VDTKIGIIINLCVLPFSMFMMGFGYDSPSADGTLAAQIFLIIQGVPLLLLFIGIIGDIKKATVEEEPEKIKQNEAVVEKPNSTDSGEEKK
jgi:hypothetical protein